MQVHQIFTDSPLRNFTYLLEGNQGHFYVIDPWDSEQVFREVEKLGGLIKGIINTHEHGDHTRGNAKIVKKTDCPVYAHTRASGKIKEADCFLQEGDELKIDNESYLKILDTPGHTFAHLCFMLVNNDGPRALFTGDTLFNAGVGNCHNGGDPEVLFESVQKYFMDLSDDIILYPGHEYLENNLSFTLDREPDNEAAQNLRSQIRGIDWLNDSYQTTMKQEYEINTFLRLDQKQIREELNLLQASDKQVFLQLRQLRNSW